MTTTLSTINDPTRHLISDKTPREWLFDFLKSRIEVGGWRKKDLEEWQKPIGRKLAAWITNNLDGLNDASISEILGGEEKVIGGLWNGLFKHTIPYVPDDQPMPQLSRRAKPLQHIEPPTPRKPPITPMKRLALVNLDEETH